MIDPRTLLLTTTLGLGLPLLAQDPGTAPVAPPAAEQPQEPASEPTDKSTGQWIAELGSTSYRTRLAAERALRKLGKDAVPALKQASKSADPEVQWRAKRVLRQIEQGMVGDEGLVERDRPGQQPDEPQVQPQKPRQPGRSGARLDPMRDQFESLFQRFERDFGIDIPRARFFEDGFFQDLREQMQGLQGRSQGMSVQIGPDGAVHVEVQQRNDKGEVENKVYDAPDLETFQREHPGVLQQNGLGMGLQPWVAQPFGGSLRGFAGPIVPGWTIDLDDLPSRAFGRLQPRGEGGSEPMVEVEPTEPPAPPPVGRRLGIAIKPSIPNELRSYLGLEAGRGLWVESVQDGSLAQALGLKPEDIVTEIAGRPIGSTQDVQQALGAIGKGDPVEVKVLRRGAELTLRADKTEAAEAAPAPSNEPLQPRGKRGGTIR